MDFAIEDSAEQSAFRKEVRDCLSPQRARGASSTRWIPATCRTSSTRCAASWAGAWAREAGSIRPCRRSTAAAISSAEKVVILYDELARIGLALPPYYDAGGRMAAPTILVWGTEEHKKRFLPPICRGEVRTWQLLTEPGAGSDLAGIKTTAMRDGDAYVVNGQKIFVGSSHGADYSWTIVVTDPKGERHKNLSWLMIPMDLPGITRARRWICSRRAAKAAAAPA